MMLLELLLLLSIKLLPSRFKDCSDIVKYVSISVFGSESDDDPLEVVREENEARPELAAEGRGWGHSCSVHRGVLRLRLHQRVVDIGTARGPTPIPQLITE